MKNYTLPFCLFLIAVMMLICRNGFGQSRELPDNIQSANCTFAPEATMWGIQEKWSSTTNVSTLIIPLIGDVDGDEVPEIVCFAPSGSDFYNVNTVLVFDSQTHAVIHSFTIPGNVSTVDAAPYGMVKLPSDHVILAICAQDNNMYGFDLTVQGSTPIWTAFTGFPAPNVGFVDFNSDGYPEIYVGNKVFDAETGTLLVTNPSVTNFGGSYAHTANHMLPSPCVANLTGDSKPELVLGNEVYEIIITNRTGTSGNSMTLSASCTPPSGIAVDGHPQVVDFNLDGYLDVFISNKNTSSATLGCYVWDVHNNTVSNALSITQNGSGKSIPLVADIDNDNAIEIVMQSNCSGNKVQAYKYNASSRSFSLMWSLGVDEDSYSNGATTFDFNNDGEMEVLISDQSTIKILNGASGSVLTALSFGECTVMQYPVIADVDADGSAEIAICGQFGAGHTNSGHLVVFCSSTVPWASARRVWNQYMYNITNVNEDLTVMHQLFNNATPFTDPQGIVRRPFNNFLQQATTIDQYGRPFYAVPDVMAVNATVNHVGDEVVIVFNYTNQGDNILNAPYYITVFANQFGGAVLQIETVNEPLRDGQNGMVELHLPASQLCNMQNLNNLVIVVNCNGGGIAQNGNLQPECDITNNTVTIPYTGHSNSNDIYETACDEFVWNGQTYTQSGTYQQQFTNMFGCDSIVYLHLTIQSVVTSEWSHENCDSYTWNGVNYNHSGNYTQTFEMSEGCDSIVTLHLTIHESYHQEWNHETCGEYSWNGHTYSQSGDYTQNFVSQYGCDSIVTLHLIINQGFNTEWSHQSCESYTWNGINYDESGDYIQEFVSQQGCDSIVTLHLTINDIIETEWSHQSCVEFNWNGVDYDESGDYVQEFVSQQGCDSIVTLHLTINGIIETEWSQQSCVKFNWNGVDYDESGDYVQEFVSQQGCDSIVTLHLTINDVIETEWSHQACVDFTWNGITYDASGDYEQQFVSVHGCDSIVTMHLVINDVLETEWEAQSCADFVWNDITYTLPGDYKQEFISVQGCDSIVTLHLTLFEPVETEIDTTFCGHYWWNGHEYTESGLYDELFTSEDGCDSIVHLQLTLQPELGVMSPISGPNHVYVSSSLVQGVYEYHVDYVENTLGYEWSLEGVNWQMQAFENECRMIITSEGTGILTIKAWNECGVADRHLEITSEFFGIEEFGDSKVAVYPNPATQKVYVEATEVKMVRLVDLQGQMLMEIVGHGNDRVELNLRDFADGIYFLEVETRHGIARKKLSVAR